MKKSLIILAALAALSAQAQTTVDSTSGSASQSGAISGSQSALNASNSGNVSATAVGNQATSASDSRSASGAVSGSQSGALGNSVYVDQRGPVSQTVNQTTRAEQILNGHTVEDVNVRNSGTTTNIQDIRYSGTTTVKSAPAIAMSGPASGPCTGVSGGIGISGPGWGFGANGSSVMDDCRMRENTRVLGMSMQSIDGTTNPQEKGEVTVLFMDAVRDLADYNKTIYTRAKKEAK